MISYKKQLMESLNITDSDLLTNKSIVIEKLFCVALLNKLSTDEISKVLNFYQEAKEELFPK